MISKSYKLPAGLVVIFVQACKKAGTTQAAELKKAMEKFIKKHRKFIIRGVEGN